MKLLLTAILYALVAGLAAAMDGAPVPGCVVRAELPLEHYGGLLVLKARVNGHPETLRLMFDSATSETYVFTHAADKVKLERAGEGTRTGVGEKGYAVQYASGVSLDLGGLLLTGLKVVVTERRVLAEVDGMIGWDILSRYVAGVDFTARTLALFEPTCDRTSPGSKVLPLGFSKGDPRIPVVRGTLAMPGRPPASGTFTVDTGASAFAFLWPPFVEKHQLEKGVTRSIPIRGGGMSGGAAYDLMRADSFQLGPFTVKGPVIGIFRHKQPAGHESDRDGILGNELFERFHVVFDYARARLILEPHARLADPFVLKRSANWTGLVAKETKEGLEVLEVLPDSPGARAGVQRGDVVVAVEGRAVLSIPIDEWLDMLSREGRTYTFSVKRGERARALDVTLTMKSYL